jgi:hypothetical protein
MPPLDPELKQRLVPNSTRLAADDGTYRTWIGLSKEDEYCLIVGVINLPGSLSAACVNSDRVLSCGAWLSSVLPPSANEPVTRRDTYLVPDGYSQTEKGVLRKDSKNLYTRDLGEDLESSPAILVARNDNGMRMEVGPYCDKSPADG